MKTIYSIVPVFLALLIFHGLEGKETNRVEDKIFLSLAHGRQFPQGKPNHELMRWESPTEIQILGDPSVEDREEVQKVCDDINRVLNRKLLSVTDEYSTFQIHFASFSEFQKLVPNRRGKTWTYFILKPAGELGIWSANILIADQIKSRETRDAAIRSMITRSLGLIGSTDRFRPSAFTEDMNDGSTSYSDFEEKMIRLLYRDEFCSGMEEKEVRRILKALSNE